MLQFKTHLERKPTDLRPPVCQIEKIIELPGDEFGSLAYHPYAERRFIVENRELMSQRGGRYHCLLALNRDGNDGILINAEGAEYIRYGAYVSHARDYVEREMERVADAVIKNALDHTSSGSWVTYFEEIKPLSGMEITAENGLAPLLLKAINDRPEPAEIEMTGDGFDIVYYLDHCRNLEDGVLEEMPQGGIRLKDVLLLGGMENVYLVHDTADIGFVPANYAALLTDQGREDHVDLLNAAVKEIHPGAYGPEIVLTGIDPELLVRFDQAAAAYDQGESMSGPSL